MKIKSCLLLLVLACLMTSCFNETGSQSTPMMLFSKVYVNPQIVGDSLIGAQDTLGSYYSEEFNMEYVDTLQLGDTAMFYARFEAFMNNLVSINATYDSVRVKMWYDIDPENESVKKMLASGSQPEKGILLFNPMYHGVVFPIYILPLEAGAHAIKMTVISDSQYPKNEAIFTMPVKATNL